MVEENTAGNESSPFMNCIKPEWDENGKLYWPGIQNQKNQRMLKPFCFSHLSKRSP
jgi:hypothetical protein